MSILKRLTLVGIVVVLTLGAAWLVTRSFAGLPSTRSPEYKETVRAFYRGLASLEVGLLDEAQAQFSRAAALAPAEPANRANLAVSLVGLGRAEEAAVELDTARSLAPNSSEVAFLQGQIASFSGRFEEAIMHFGRAVDLDSDHLRARFALAQELDRSGAEEKRSEAQRLLEAVLARQPDNLAVLVQHARVAAARGDGASVTDTLERLTSLSVEWPPVAITQLAALSDAVETADLARAATVARLLRNVLVRLPAFRDDQAAVSVSAELVAEPLSRFLRLPSPAATAAPLDNTLTYVIESLEGDVPAVQAVVAIVPPSGNGEAAIFAANQQTVQQVVVSETGLRFDFPGLSDEPDARPPTSHGLLALDWNGDYLMDLALAGADGVRLLVQTESGSFSEMTPTAADASVSTLNSYGIWAADTEMDGDLDIIVGPLTAAPWVMRNNADGTWLATRPFPALEGLRGFVWGDLDHDGDPDAVLLDAEGALHPLENLQAGQFGAWPPLEPSTDTVAFALGDLNADGRVDLVTLDSAGVLWRSSWSTAVDGTIGNDGWDTAQVTTWPSFSLSPSTGTVGSHRLLLADLDNNGAIDVLGSSAAGTHIWLSDEQSRLKAFDTMDAEIFAVGDLNGDGWLDLIGLDERAPVRLLGQGSAGYGWQQIRPRAHVTAGDQRINAFGVGGEIELRAGLLVQKQVLTGAPAHFGLGRQVRADVTRIVWPNGVMQADFEFDANQTIVAEQRLKGSCPWVFAHDGTEIRFVTDFLWRSPLGLRINAQETADVAQTEDWVLIRGDQLAPQAGAYDLRITGELWETHFFDHVSLLVVDHPEDTEVFVDERFARTPVAHTPHVTGPSRPVTQAWDDAGNEVSHLVQTRDGRYVATFERGTHQGVTRDHYIELNLDIDANADADEAMWLLAYGWVYPTDSSINVAMGQGQHPVPHGVALEALDSHGRWIVLHPDLGFPAGKLKTMVIELPRLPDGRLPQRVRLRTNLEVYWDWIGSASRMDVAARDIRRLAPEVATLRYRGYSHTDLVGPRGLEIPRYEVANIHPRWRDLVGYHTRFGDVRELLAAVDDRYVIMNAGDELRFSFPAPAPPRSGWRRDFVLIGDGWEKDGDFNTTHSKTVGPLPSHDRPAYDPGASPALELDPIYRQYPEDWINYHTRFVTPDRFLRGLWRSPKSSRGVQPSGSSVSR